MVGQHESPAHHQPSRLVALARAGLVGYFAVGGFAAWALRAVGVDAVICAGVAVGVLLVPPLFHFLEPRGPQTEPLDPAQGGWRG